MIKRFREGHEVTLNAEAARPKSSGPKVLKLFLASSFELKKEREKIEEALNRKNKLLRKRGFMVELLIWEDGKHIGTSLRSQDNYNLEIEQCDLFVMLFYSKVGKYSLEEFELAKSLYEQNEMPRICIFQKDVDLPKNLKKADADSRYAFLDLLAGLKHFPTLFQNEDQLVRQLEDAIDKLLVDEAFVQRLKEE